MEAKKRRITMTAPLPATALLAVRERQRQEYASSGVREFDRLHNGLPRGAITELVGRRSTGRTSMAYACLAGGTGRLECCAYVDARGSFDPRVAASAGIDLERLVWVRCGGDAATALKAADLLLHAGGFGVVCLDLGGVPARVLNRIPTSYWFRFRRAIQNTSTVLLVMGDDPNARSCASMGVRFEAARPRWTGVWPARLFRGLGARATTERPGPPVALQFESATI
jgi:hypothetical protein